MDNDDRLDLRNGIAWRAPLAAALFFLAWQLLKMGGAMGQLAALIMAVTGGILLGPLFAIAIAAPTGSLFYPRGRAVRQPYYSGAIGRRMRERYDDAIEEYQRIADEFPQELYPYIAMVEIALNDLHDFQRADDITRRGLQRLRDDTSRTQLVRAHRALKQRTLADMEERAAATTDELVPRLADDEEDTLD